MFALALLYEGKCSQNDCGFILSVINLMIIITGVAIGIVSLVNLCNNSKERDFLRKFTSVVGRPSIHASESKPTRKRSFYKSTLMSFTFQIGNAQYR